jgi:ribosomal protein S18
MRLMSIKRSTEIEIQLSTQRLISMILRDLKEDKDNSILIVRLIRKNYNLPIIEEKPATFINRPLSRSQIRKKFLRQLKKKDINWKNTPLLCKFMNDSGKIMNRY